MERRRLYPELVARMADLGADAKLLCITDHAGIVLWGKEPPQDRFYSADFLIAAATSGERQAKRGRG
jgi:hypothetical protein